MESPGRGRWATLSLTSSCALIAAFATTEAANAHVAGATPAVRAPLPSARGGPIGRVRRNDSGITNIVVMVQENRSVDDLFNGYPGADTVTVDPYTGTPLMQVSMGGTQGAWGPGHGHAGAFVHECAAIGSGPCRMTGFATVSGGCPQPGAPYCTAYAYAPPSETAGYFALAQRGVFYDEVFQANGGPSFPAHQFAIAGQAGGYNADGTADATYPYSWSENGHAGSVGGTNCGAPAGKLVTQVNITTPYPGNHSHSDFPCSDYATIFDELPASYSWHYYANNATGFWAAPNTIRHLYSSGGSPNLSIPPSGVLTAIKSGTLANLVYVIPKSVQSDHPGANHVATAGSDWVNSVVNAVESSSYGSSTLILITWDDWGGFYDHVLPPTWFDANGYGFRVPCIAIGPGLPAGTVDHGVRNQSAFILQSIESVWGLPSLNQQDARGPGMSVGPLHRRNYRALWRPLPVHHPESYYLRQGSDPPNTPEEDDG